MLKVSRGPEPIVSWLGVVKGAGQERTSISVVEPLIGQGQDLGSISSLSSFHYKSHCMILSSVSVLFGKNYQSLK